MTTLNKVTIYGLAGTNGSGKDTVAEVLADKHNFFVASATDMLRTELEKRSLPTDRIHKSQLSAEWRRNLGMAAIVDKAYEEFSKQTARYQGIIIGSLRHPGEADRIHELGGKVIWVDADARVRYDRIQNTNRGRIEDKKTFKEFVADEEREMFPEGDEATLHGAEVKRRSDIFIENNGNDLRAFKEKVMLSLGVGSDKKT
jgi:cytidylate kinase